MIKKVATVAISAIIGVLLVITVLTPILMGATSETLTTRNTGSFFAAVSDDGTEHTIIISAGTGSFVIKTDGKTDITPTMGTYNPGGVYVADAIGIGIYEGYTNSDGVLTSQAGVYPTVSQTVDVFRSQSLAGNGGITNGTYQLWNFYQSTMLKIMGLTIIGNTDSQYMMGDGYSGATGSIIPQTGTTTSAYTKSASDTDAVCLFIENNYGSTLDIVGDTTTTGFVLMAGNTLGGVNVRNTTVKSVLTTPITLPNVDTKYIATISLNGETFGVPITTNDTISTSGEGINDGIWTASGTRLVDVGGNNKSGNKDGLFTWDSALGLSATSTIMSSRLAYVIPDLDSTATTYGYVISFSEGGSTITGVQALVDGTLTDENPTGTTLNSFWDFDTTTGIGPFGSYYALINLADVDTESDTDYLTETMLSTKKGEIAYILDPSDFTQTLAGNSYTASNYNAMLIVPTVYWGVVDQKLYMSNDPSTFSDVEGLELQPYAHTYTVDPSVDTGNPVTTASATIVYGADYIVRLYSTGDVYLITQNAMTYLGQASGENTVELTVTGDVLGYTPSGGSATTIDDVLAYIASTGEYVQCKNPMYSTSQEGAQFIIGGYANNLTTTTDDVVDIGYCLTVDAADLSLSTITVLNPVSDASNTVDTNGAVWGESTLIKSDLYKVGDLTITTTWSDTGKSVATYNYYLAPEKVTYTNPNYLDNGPVESILNVLPIIIVAGLLLGILSMIVVGKLKE